MKTTEAKKKAAAVVRLLKEKYPAAECALKYEGEPWKLLVMGRLSAQCTDKRVNEVCQKLFEIYPDAASLASASLEDVEELIRSCGLFHTKARDVVSECAVLTEIYDGELPSDMEELLSFPGVGRKIANLLRGDIFGLPAIVADTHCIRLSARLGFTPSDCRDPNKVEKVLSALVEPEEQSDLCHRLVMLGRETCTAKAPDCPSCPLKEECAAAAGAQKGKTDA